jgi:hypothetical protein
MPITAATVVSTVTLVEIRHISAVFAQDLEPCVRGDGGVEATRPTEGAGRGAWLSWLQCRAAKETAVTVASVTVTLSEDAMTILDFLSTATMASTTNEGRPLLTSTRLVVASLSSADATTPQNQMSVTVGRIECSVLTSLGLEMGCVVNSLSLQSTRLEGGGGVHLSSMVLETPLITHRNGDVLCRAVRVQSSVVPANVLGNTAPGSLFLYRVQTGTEVEVEVLNVAIDPALIDRHRLLTTRRADRRSAVKDWVTKQVCAGVAACEGATAVAEPLEGGALAWARARALDAWLSRGPFNDVCLPWSEPHEDDAACPLLTNAPSSVCLFAVQSLLLPLRYQGARLGSLRASNVQVHSLTVDGIMSQVGGDLCSLHLIDETLTDVHHKVLLRPLLHEADSHVGSLGFHFSRAPGHCPLLELRGLGLRFIYMQRFWLMFISYVRDRVMPAVYGPKQPAVVPECPGVMRFNLTLTDSEIHLPCHSKARDGVAILMRRLYVHKSSVVPHVYGDDYMLGPWRRTEAQNGAVDGRTEGQRWLCQDFAALWTLHGTDECRRWNWSGIAHELMLVPRGPAAGPVPMEEVNGMQYSIGLADTTICTWCSLAAIISGTTIRAKFQLDAALPLDTPLADQLNTTSVEVDWQGDADLTLTQGAYMCLINLIQQNFSEDDQVLPKSFDESVPPKRAAVSDLLFRGESCLDASLPRLSRVPLRISRGRILAVSDVSLFEPYLTSDISGDVQHPLYSDVTALPLEHAALELLSESVPDWPHLDFHRGGCFDVIMLPLDDDAEDAGHNTYGHAIFELAFQGLDVTFNKKHHLGGGNIDLKLGRVEIVGCGDGSDEELGAGAFVHFPLGSSDGVRDATVIGALSPVPLGSPFDAAPQFTYCQEDAANLRRCLATLRESAIVVNLPVISAVLQFVVDPVDLMWERYMCCLRDSGELRAMDFQKMLDVEVVAENGTVFCLPNVTESDGSYSICLRAGLRYEHSWRGFMLAGPARVAQETSFSTSGVFISALSSVAAATAREQAASICESLQVTYSGSMMLAPAANTAEADIAALKGTFEPSAELLGLPRGHSPGAHRTMNIVLSGAGVGVGAEVGAVTQRSFGDSDHDDSELGAVRIRTSMQDVLFLASMVQYLQRAGSGDPRAFGAPLLERLRPWLASTADMRHLPVVTSYTLHTPLGKEATLVQSESHLRTCDIEVLLRNNTFNLDMARLQLDGTQVSLTRVADGCNFACGVKARVCSFNDRLGTYEPIVENLEATVIAAVEDSVQPVRVAQSQKEDRDGQIQEAGGPTGGGGGTQSTTQLTRFDVYCFPLLANISHTMLSGMVRTLSLPDTVTTNQKSIPPYLIVNELGLQVKCVFQARGGRAATKIIMQDMELPLDVLALSHDMGLGAADAAEGLRDHTVGITFTIQGLQCRSRKRLSLDCEGVLLFELEVFAEKGELLAMPSRDHPDLPIVAADVIMRHDGGRELVLRSIVTVHNDTQCRLDLNFQTFVGCGAVARKPDAVLMPGEDLRLPLKCTRPHTPICVRLDRRGEWEEALPCLGMAVSRGKIGFATRLAASVFGASHASGGGGGHDGQGSAPHNQRRWLGLVRPVTYKPGRDGGGGGGTIKLDDTRIVWPSMGRDKVAATAGDGGRDTGDFRRSQSHMASVADLDARGGGVLGGPLRHGH